MYLINNFVMKFFRNTCFLLSLICIIAFVVDRSKADALQIVYPKTPNTEISANSTFIVGNATPGSKLTINDKEVKVHENGSFVEVVPLKDGFNRIKIESVDGLEHEILSYIVKKVPPKTLTVTDKDLTEFAPNEYIYAAVVKNNTPLRAQPDENSKRLTHLNADTVLMLNGKKGDYFRVSLTPTQNAWIKADSVVNYSTINGKMLAVASDVNVSEDKLYEYIRTSLDFPVPYKITETDNGLMLNLYNIKANNADTKLFAPDETLKSLAINTVSSDNVSTYFVELNQNLWGYDAYYEGKELVLRIRKAPKIDTAKPLNGITIAIDAGHGGADYGAIGPTGVKEKEINLDIAKKLQKTLEASGAQVVMTRVEDVDVPLYERPKVAKKSDALILLSIHANALSDGANPYEKHGTSVFYYNKESAELDKVLRDTMIKELETRDDGVCNCSFVMTRPTMPLSVVIEVAYMIHPEEYTLLLDDKFRNKASESIKDGLEKFLLNSVNSDNK